MARNGTRRSYVNIAYVSTPPRRILDGAAGDETAPFSWERGIEEDAKLACHIQTVAMYFGTYALMRHCSGELPCILETVHMQLAHAVGESVAAIGMPNFNCIEPLARHGGELKH